MTAYTRHNTHKTPAQQQYLATVLLVPTCNAANTGRSFSQNFEHTIAFDFVEQLQKILNMHYSNVRCLLSHQRARPISPFQQVNTANCLFVDLVIACGFYKETEEKPSVHLYSFSYGQEFIKKKWDLSWCPYEQTYLIKKTETQQYAKLCQEVLNEYPNILNMYGPYRIPLKPLIGMIPPALLFEIGIRHDKDWQQIIEPISDAVSAVINTILSNLREWSI